jgi:anti-sigma factor RsiW
MTRKVVDLTCKEVVELVTDYLTQAMPAEDRAELEQHLFTCPPCTTYIEQMRTLVTLAGRLDENAGTREVPSDVLDLFRRWKQK